jgi:hypothetical protein
VVDINYLISFLSSFGGGKPAEKEDR